MKRLIFIFLLALILPTNVNGEQLSWLTEKHKLFINVSGNDVKGKDIESFGFTGIITDSGNDYTIQVSPCSINGTTLKILKEFVISKEKIKGTCPNGNSFELAIITVKKNAFINKSNTLFLTPESFKLFFEEEIVNVAGYTAFGASLGCWISGPANTGAAVAIVAGLKKAGVVRDRGQCYNVVKSLQNLSAAVLTAESEIPGWAIALVAFAVGYHGECGCDEAF